MFRTEGIGYQASLYFVWVSLTVALLLSLWRAEWVVSFVTGITLLLTLAPFLLQRRYHIRIPLGFMVASVFFIYATLYLGEVGGFYERFWWWDLLLHAGSAVGFGLIGVVVLIFLFQGQKVTANPLVLSLFAFSFAVAIGALWEIFEFTGDQILGTGMQKNGLVDTMWDLIVDAGGAAFAALNGYWYLKGDHSGIFREVIHEGVVLNKR